MWRRMKLLLCIIAEFFMQAQLQPLLRKRISKRETTLRFASYKSIVPSIFRQILWKLLLGPFAESAFFDVNLAFFDICLDETLKSLYENDFPNTVPKTNFVLIICSLFHLLIVRTTLRTRNSAGK